MSVTRWTLYDPVLTEEYVMQINPSDGGSPSNNKKVQYQATTAPDGLTIIFEGRDEPQSLEWTGTILTEEHLNDLLYWFQKRRQVRLTDDLGRQYWIYITKFEPKRKRAIHSPFKHEYTMTATILDWDF